MLSKVCTQSIYTKNLKKKTIDLLLGGIGGFFKLKRVTKIWKKQAILQQLGLQDEKNLTEDKIVRALLLKKMEIDRQKNPYDMMLVDPHHFDQWMNPCAKG